MVDQIKTDQSSPDNESKSETLVLMMFAVVVYPAIMFPTMKIVPAIITQIEVPMSMTHTRMTVMV